MLTVPWLSRVQFKWQSVQKRIEKLNKSLFWNAGLRMVKELYLDLVLIGIIRLKTHEFDTKYEKAMTILAICSSGFLALYFIATVMIIYLNRNKTDDDVV